MEQIVTKVNFDKNEYFISIRYKEGEDNKLLESNEFYNKAFREHLETLRHDLNKYLGFDGKNQLVVIIDSITFSLSEKQSTKLTFTCKLMEQTAGIGISLANGDAYLGLTENEDDILASVYRDINILQADCVKYLNGERSQQDLELEMQM